MFLFIDLSSFAAFSCNKQNSWNILFQCIIRRLWKLLVSIFACFFMCSKYLWCFQREAEQMSLVRQLENSTILFLSPNSADNTRHSQRNLRNMGSSIKYPQKTRKSFSLETALPIWRIFSELSTLSRGVHFKVFLPYRYDRSELYHMSVRYFYDIPLDMKYSTFI